ncbi:glycosyltransferase family 1 protein [Atractiella rhizophila]|nr:glycosyltransferase family 1 protein [Atractiella rhizophila]
MSIIVLSTANWGHARPLLTLSVTFANTFSYRIFFLVQGDLIGKLKNELVGQKVDSSRVSLVAVGPNYKKANPNAPGNFFLKSMEDLYASLEGLLDALNSRNEVFTDALDVDHAVGNLHPKCIWEDMWAGNAGVRSRKAGKHKLPVLAWIVNPVHAWMRTVAPAEDGGEAEVFDDARAVFDDPTLRNGRNFYEIVAEFLQRNPRRASDHLIKLAGFEPIYEWEATLQEMKISDNPTAAHAYLEVIPRLHEFNREADGLIIHTIEEYEPPDALVAGYRVLGQNSSRPLFLVGAQQPPSVWQAGELKAEGKLKHPVAVHEADTKAIEFLDKCETTFGEKTVLYVSFGSFFWPYAHPEIVEDMIETMLDISPPLPIIVALASPFASLSSNLQNRIAENQDRCLFLDWVPQTLVLQHPALGLFLTHAGQNSTTETLIFDVPTILCPFTGDQATNSILLSQHFDCGIELLQFRTGEAMKKGIAFRGGPAGTKIEGTSEARRSELREAIGRMRSGEEAQRKRKNAERIGRIWRNSVKEGGSANKHLREMETWIRNGGGEANGHSVM